jgi:hypothetical protein
MQPSLTPHSASGSPCLKLQRSAHFVFHLIIYCIHTFYLSCLWAGSSLHPEWSWGYPFYTRSPQEAMHEWMREQVVNAVLGQETISERIRSSASVYIPPCWWGRPPRKEAHHTWSHPLFMPTLASSDSWVIKIHCICAGKWHSNRYWELLRGWWEGKGKGE